MDLQNLSEACFASPIDLFHAHGDELVRELRQRCLAALVEATGDPATRWRSGSVVFHRSANAAIAVGAATATGWVERIADDGSVVLRVVAASPGGVERIDATLAFDDARSASWCDCVVDSASAAVARAVVSERPAVTARRRAPRRLAVDATVATTATAR